MPIPLIMLNNVVSREHFRKDTNSFFWYRRAARKNDVKAFYNLELPYKHGDGVKPSGRWPKHFFQKVNEAGHQGAVLYLEEMTHLCFSSTK